MTGCTCIAASRPRTVSRPSRWLPAHTPTPGWAPDVTSGGPYMVAMVTISCSSRDSPANWLLMLGLPWLPDCWNEACNFGAERLMGCASAGPGGVDLLVCGLGESLAISYRVCLGVCSTPWALVSWRFLSPLWVNFFWQIEHSYGFSPGGKNGIL